MFISLSGFPDFLHIFVVVQLYRNCCCALICLLTRVLGFFFEAQIMLRAAYLCVCMSVGLETSKKNL